MFLFLPMAFLSIRMIVASREIDDDSWPDTAMHENGYNHVTTDNRTRQFLTEMSKMWKAELLKGESKKQENDDPGVYVSADSSKMKIEGKRKETVDSWVDLAREEKIGSEGRKNPWLYWWADKRLSLHEPSFSTIRRPIRVPFNSWGGKRAEKTGNLQTKRSKLSYDRSDRNIFPAGLNGVKRMAEMEKVDWKIPFNSWGGKRADRSTDREQFLSLSENPKDINVLDIIKGQLYSRYN
ncbi:hypothetical protein ANTQUA_LOCUS2400 [Anthophora quadrimaculata]